MKCWEYVGRASATQQRRRCERDAIRYAYFKGDWRPLCRYHVGQYSDLPQRSPWVKRALANQLPPKVTA